jgi:hypothetical protein
MSRSRWHARDLAAFLLGLLLLAVAAAAVLHLIVGVGSLIAALIPVAVPIILIVLAVLALMGARR